MRKTILTGIAALSFCGVAHADTIPQSVLMATPSGASYAYPATIVSFNSSLNVYGLDSGNNDWDGLHISAFGSTSMTFNFSQPVSSFAFDFTAHSFGSGSYEERFVNLSPSNWTLTNNSVSGHETTVVNNEVVPLVDDGWGTVTFTGSSFTSASFDLNYFLGQPAGTVLTELRYTQSDIPEPTTLALVAGAFTLLVRRR